MANIVQEYIYQINQRVIPLAQVTQIGFPTQGMILGDCFNSPTRALPTGPSVYSFITDTKGNRYYTTKTFAALVTDFG